MQKKSYWENFCSKLKNTNEGKNQSVDIQWDSFEVLCDHSKMGSKEIVESICRMFGPIAGNIIEKEILEWKIDSGNEVTYRNYKNYENYCVSVFLLYLPLDNNLDKDLEDNNSPLCRQVLSGKFYIHNYNISNSKFWSKIFYKGIDQNPPIDNNNCYDDNNQENQINDNTLSN